MSMRKPDPERETVATRQGTKQKMNMRVLVISLALICLLFAGFYLVFLAESPPQTLGPKSTPQPSDPSSPGPAP